ncbi:GAF and ANTAR domain-containing protein [Kribbella sp. NPDC056861]|uniref:GAF and ANTAR domain-containing protein n=1 Tax=Kribbella sp. NPDC056861 TaxID=3154857 RepID=UPI00343B61F3
MSQSGASEADRPGTDPQAGFGADVFARLAGELYDASGIDETVETVVRFALQAEACSYAGVMLTLRGEREIAAVTDPLVTKIYEFQSGIGEGPILTAVSEGVTVRVPDSRTETRWPAWGARLTKYRIRSSLHVPMWASAQLIGVLSLFNTAPDAFTVDDEAIAHILARHASVAVANARNDESMKASIDARKLVGQAMGILMERFDLDEKRAFELLKRYSQQHNIKLRDVAVELVNTRQLRRSHGA